jgi:hypothetical protein
MFFFSHRNKTADWPSVLVRLCSLRALRLCDKHPSSMKPVGLSLLCLLLASSVSLAGEWSGYVALEGRYFFQEGLVPSQQYDSNLSISAEPEYYHDWDDGRQSLVFKPFVRLDQRDDERTHWDIRELEWTYAGQGWEARAGIGKVYWGVTEAEHLVDIINQTDLVENPDGEQKLGQPMVKLSSERDWGTLDFFLLPGFRERTYPGEDGRIRTHPWVDTDHAEYESGAGDKRLDAAVRWSHYFGNWDVGLAHFYGTGREPLLLPGRNDEGKFVLVPFYEIIHQTSLDVQATIGSWLWKFESLYRDGMEENFYALTGGLEYTRVGIMESSSDLGMLAEVMFDERREEATNPFDNDVFLALRWALNDEQSSELLFGVIYDWETHSKLINLEASRRLGQNYTLSVQARAWLDVRPGDLLLPLNHDDYLEISLARYF